MQSKEPVAAHLKTNWLQPSSFAQQLTSLHFNVHSMEAGETRQNGEVRFGGQGLTWITQLFRL